MIELVINEPTEKELREAVIEIEKILDKKMDRENKGHKERLKNKMMENFFKEVERAEHRVISMEINERRTGRLAQMTLRDINEIK